jgi:hypothetical protein
MRLRTHTARPFLRVNSEVDSLPHECPRVRAPAPLAAALIGAALLPAALTVVV